jgi:hypothetical protein
MKKLKRRTRVELPGNGLELDLPIPTGCLRAAALDRFRNGYKMVSGMRHDHQRYGETEAHSCASSLLCLIVLSSYTTRQLGTSAAPRSIPDCAERAEA